MSNRSSKIDNYIEKSAAFAQPILREIRDIYHDAAPGIEEDIKWGMPAFMHKGIVSNLAAFKNHVSFGFWKGKLMKDPKGIFNDRERAQITAIKLKTVDDIPARDVLISYIHEAIDLNEKGIKLPVKEKTAKQELTIPAELTSALKANSKAASVFEGFSYSNKRDYADWISDAKREDTRARRLTTAIEWISEGKPRNWKYMKKK